MSMNDEERLTLVKLELAKAHDTLLIALNLFASLLMR